MKKTTILNGKKFNSSAFYARIFENLQKIVSLESRKLIFLADFVLNAQKTP